MTHKFWCKCVKVNAYQLNALNVIQLEHNIGGLGTHECRYITYSFNITGSIFGCSDNLREYAA